MNYVLACNNNTFKDFYPEFCPLSLKWLIFSDFGDNQKEIAELLGYKKSSFSQIMNGKVPISDKFIDNIASIDKNINKVWIKTGKGSMLKSSAEASSSCHQEDGKEVLALLKENTSNLNKINTLQEQ